MLKNTLILTVTEDKEFGGIGLLIDGMKTEGVNPAQDGLLIAHDILEHVNTLADIGSIDDELEALGAIWFVRGQFNDINRGKFAHRISPHENLASDIIRMFRDAFYGHPVEIESVPEYEDSGNQIDFDEIFNYVENDYVKEFDDDEILGDLPAFFQQYKAAAIARMHIGYNKAVIKYNDKAEEVNRLFWAIVDEVNKTIKRCCSEGYLGMQFELYYSIDDTGHAFARIDEHYPEEFDEEDED